MSDAALIASAVEGEPMEPYDRSNDHALHDHALPAIVRGFIAINSGPATETMAIEEAGWMPRLYATYQPSSEPGERVRVVMVSRLGDCGISRKDERYGYFARVSIYDLTDFSDEMYPTAPAARPFVKQFAIADSKGFWVQPWNGVGAVIEMIPSAAPYLFTESAKAHRAILKADRHGLLGLQVIPLLLTRVKV